MKKSFLLFLLLLGGLLLGGCSGPAPQQEGRLLVSASFYPMAELAKGVGGELVHVQTLAPEGVEPHDFEPSPRAITALGRSQVFIYNGLVEPWAAGALQAVAERQVLALCAGEGLYQLPDGTQDPHVWLNLAKAQIQVQRICAAFSQADPAHAAAYQRNAAAYGAQLARLDGAYKELGRKSRHRTIVCSHAAFGHLAAAYGFQQQALLGLSPEAEPTAATLQALAALVRREGLSYVFMEAQASGKVAALLAQEAGVQVLPLNPAEGSGPPGQPQSFLEIMEGNLRNLAKGLQ